MADSVEQGFERFLLDLRHSRVESAAAATHRTSIYAKLQDSFGASNLFRTGSFGNGTNISGYSDVDYFVTIPTNNLKADSSVTLAHVANALRERFPTTPNIRVNGPAVQIPFGLDGAERTEIVPADATGRTILGFRQFDMPDSEGGWKFSAPESHNAYVTEMDKRLGGRVKPFIRLLKAWKYIRNVPIRSFYLELFSARYANSEQAIVYDIDISRVLTQLHQTQLAAFYDPRFPNDWFSIEPCNTEAMRLDAMSKLANADRWAREAVSSRQAGLRHAFDRWDLVYDNKFPIYTGQ